MTGISSTMRGPERCHPGCLLGPVVMAILAEATSPIRNIYTSTL